MPWRPKFQSGKWLALLANLPPLWSGCCRRLRSARAAAIDPAIAVASSRGRGSVMVAAVSLAECDGLSAVRSLFVEAAYMFSSVQSQIKGG